MSQIFESIASDIRLAFRTLRKDITFATIVVLSLAIGIGVNGALFSLVDSLMLRVLPIAAPDRVVLIQRIASQNAFSKAMPLTAESVEAVAGLTPMFSEVFTFADLDRPEIVIEGTAEPNGAVEKVSRNFFSALGVKPVIGRADPDGSGAVISHRFWMTRFGGTPGAIGRVISIDGQASTISGVAPPDFFGVSLDTSPDVWLSVDGAPPVSRHLMARLQAGVGIAQATAAADSLFHHLDEQSPATVRRIALRTEITPVGRGISDLRVAYRNQLLALMILSSLVLLLTCANIGGLFVVRNAGRLHELNLRAALGAGRFQLLNQLVMEGTLLAVLGGMFAWLVARWGVAGILAMLPLSSRPQPLEFRMDARMIGFTVLVSVVSALLFAVVPAWRASKLDLSNSFRVSPGLGRSPSGRSLGRMLVACQVALSVVLLAGAGLFLQTLRNMNQVHPGFDARNLLQVELDTRGGGYRGAQVKAVYGELIDSLSSIPGVERVTGSRNPVLMNPGIRIGLEGGFPVPMYAAQVGPAFFETMRIPVIRGRTFTPADVTRRDGISIVVTESYARQVFPGEDILGKRIIGRDNAEIVGITSDAKLAGVRGEELPIMYSLAFRADPDRVSALQVRTRIDPESLVAAVRQKVVSVNPKMLVSVRPMVEILEASMSQERLAARCSALFGVLGLILAATGIFGLASFVILQRTREIGVRIALGAGHWDVIRESIRDTAGVFAVGLLVGGAVSASGLRLLNSWISGLLFGLAPTDWANMLSSVMLMLVSAIAACLIPAIRAVRIDPVQSIRNE